VNDHESIGDLRCDMLPRSAGGPRAPQTVEDHARLHAAACARPTTEHVLIEMVAELRAALTTIRDAAVQGRERALPHYTLATIEITANQALRGG
jgi:hypothetical protein